jgi:hypothetical protein
LYKLPPKDDIYKFIQIILTIILDFEVF